MGRIRNPLILIICHQMAPEAKNQGRTGPVHSGAFCQFPFRWIYYYGNNKSSEKVTGKTHPCAVGPNTRRKPNGLDFMLSKGTSLSFR